MKKVSFVQENGFCSTGANLAHIANRHQASKKHVANYTAYKLLGNIDIACALDEQRQRKVARHNRDASRYSKIMRHHVDISSFLAAQGLAFRGHDESRSSCNRGNFLELLELLACYSDDLRSFLDNDRITYTSHGPQNELIECLSEEVRGEIQRRIDASTFVAVMMDDSSDASNVEQTVVSVRLVYDGEVEEHMLGVVDCSDDQSAENLTSILLSTLEKYKVMPATCKEKVIGQSYDGAAVMSGSLNGVQKKVQEHYPFAFYNHCVAHRMSLCAAQSAMKIPKIAKFFGIVDKLIKFFRNSPKRTTSLGHNLPKPGDTRWLSRDTAISAIDTHHEAIGTAFYEISHDVKEKTETQANARGFGTQMQDVEFVYFLKLYRKIFELSTPIVTVMQKPSLDPVQLRSMINDFVNLLSSFNFSQVWEDTLLADPNFPSVRARTGWRAMDQEINGSQSSWRSTLENIARQVCQSFVEQINWRFDNLDHFKWIDLIHPSKFDERRKASAANQRALINELKNLYPFAVTDPIAVENNLEILYGNSEILTLLNKAVCKRDAVVAKKKESRRKHLMESEETALDIAVEREALDYVEKKDEFEIESKQGIDFDSVKEGYAGLQDLLSVIKDAELEEALPQVMTLLKLAAVTPLTSVHCERVFSRMKRVISDSRSRMKQSRKEQLLLLQVEHKILRHLNAMPNFKENVIARFKSYNARRFERFSKK